MLSFGLSLSLRLSYRSYWSHSIEWETAFRTAIDTNNNRKPLGCLFIAFYIYISHKQWEIHSVAPFVRQFSSSSFLAFTAKGIQFVSFLLHFYGFFIFFIFFVWKENKTTKKMRDERCTLPILTICCQSDYNIRFKRESEEWEWPKVKWNEQLIIIFSCQNSPLK